MLPLNDVYGCLTIVVALLALVVALRLSSIAVRCHAEGGRLAMLIAAAFTLVGIGVVSLFDAVDNLIWHREIPILSSAWLACIARIVMISWFEMFGRHAVERAEFECRLAAQATTDPLTGILNRRATVEQGAALGVTAKRFGHPLAVMMIDIDHFKMVNDHHGHDVGDKMLCLFTSVVKDCLREVDVFGRLGGEEFVVLMPETTREGAIIAAERIRAVVEQAELDLGEQTLSITVSIGAIAGAGTLEDALKKADEALYRAKNNGRNCVVMASSDLELAPVANG